MRSGGDARNGRARGRRRRSREPLARSGIEEGGDGGERPGSCGFRQAHDDDGDYPPELVCGGTVRPCTCYLLTTTLLLASLTTMLLVGQAALQSSSALAEMRRASVTAHAALEPLALHRDVVAMTMERGREILTDPRVRSMDMAGMVATSANIEGHIANISTSLDTVTRAWATIVADPRIQAVDWAQHIANISQGLVWMQEEDIGQKVETALDEVSDLLLRVIHAASAMSALAGPTTSGSG